MKEADVLKEFLVALGWKIDEAGFKKFNAAVASVSGNVLKLGSAVTAVATEVFIGTERIASKFKDLYFASQIAGTTVTNLEALGFAEQQVGLTAGTLQGALTSLNVNLKSNPGLAGMATQLLGINVAGRDTDSVLRSLVGRLSSMPDYQAIAFAGQFGLDAATYLQLKKNLPELTRERKRYLDMLEKTGLSEKELAITSKEFKNSLNALTTSFEVLADSGAGYLMPKLKTLMDFFNASVFPTMAKVNKETGGFASAAVEVGLATGGTAALIKLAQWYKNRGKVPLVKETVGQALGGAGETAAEGAGFEAAGAAGGSAGARTFATLFGNLLAKVAIVTTFITGVQTLVEKGSGGTESLGTWLYDVTHWFEDFNRKFLPTLQVLGKGLNALMPSIGNSQSDLQATLATLANRKLLFTLDAMNPAGVPLNYHQKKEAEAERLQLHVETTINVPDRENYVELADRSSKANVDAISTLLRVSRIHQ